MNIFKLLLGKRQKEHQHSWIHQYSTGTPNSKWMKCGGSGFSCSDVYKCECGQWAVKHRSDPDREYIPLEK